MADGLLVIDKPSGPTSHDIVARVRRATGVKRVGHAGTLDPLATGVVVVGIGRATRLLRYVQDSRKEYIARVRFGIATDSLDADGREISRAPMPLTEDQVASALSGFRGNIVQTPPMVSAVQIGGRRLHEMARAGEEVERQPRPVTVFSIEVVGFEGGEFPLATIAVECSKGTYVRVLADDIARILGGRAHLEGLRRTRIGSFGLDLALTLEDLDRWETSLLPLVAAVGPMPRLVVDDAQRLRAIHGRPLEAVGMEGSIAVIDPAGNLMAVYVAGDGVAKAEVVVS
ncbi:MAG TPA: tRNA pseudouridine(55) synthase TruB [Acidimicrobiia bacterium]|nr:tRNA pseudouridine(55) synthase TruB [Acidimicrobiia bacterium]